MTSKKDHPQNEPENNQQTLSTAAPTETQPTSDSDTSKTEKAPEKMVTIICGKC